MDRHHRHSQIQSIVSPQSPRSPVDPDSPTMMREHDPELDHGHPRHKITVLAKVKEKARKWRQTLTRKKHGDNNATTPSWGVTLEDDEEEDLEQQHVVGHLPSISENRAKEQAGCPNKKKVAFVVIEKPLPTDAAVSAATDVIASKIRNISIDSPRTASSSSEDSSKVQSIPAPSSSPARATTATSLGKGGDDDAVSHQKNQEQEEEVEEEEEQAGGGTWVKEYLMQKLEPGENERALSQVISETISSPGDVGVVEKVKKAVTSLLATNQNQPSAVHSPAPLSTNPHHDTTEEEESHGKRLQMN